MAYLNTETKEYPVSEKELRLRFPNIAFPRLLTGIPAPWVNVFPTPKPEVTNLQQALQIGTEVDKLGNHVQVWVISDKFSDTTTEGVTTTKLEQETAYLANELARSNEAANALIIAEMDAADLKIIRSVVEGDTNRLTAHKASQALLRAKLK